MNLPVQVRWHIYIKACTSNGTTLHFLRRQQLQALAGFANGAGMICKVKPEEMQTPKKKIALYQSIEDFFLAIRNKEPITCTPFF